jgi:enamine deaminase RidA (YjgF/YER057c/UK114 family)
MPERREISSGSPWEAAFGYSRAVRIGPLFQTSLTSPADDQGRIVGQGVYGQARQALLIVGRALAQAGMSFDDVVATRFYMLDTSQWEDAARAHVEAVTHVRPALSFIGVANFFDPAILVEVEITAYRPADTAGDDGAARPGSGPAHRR